MTAFLPERKQLSSEARGSCSKTCHRSRWYFKLLLAALFLSLSSLAQAQITVFTECNFQGKAVPLPPGLYTAKSLKRAGLGDNTISSIVVAEGFSATLYEDNRFAGRSGTLYATSNCLDRDRFDDTATSLTVQKRGQEEQTAKQAMRQNPNRNRAAGVTVYSFCDYRGVAAELSPGEYRLSDLKDAGINNNDISSIRVPRGYQVTVYENDFFRGRSLELQDNDNCLRNEGLDEQISSLTIRLDPRLATNNTDSASTNAQSVSNKVVAYSACDFRGVAVELKAGEYRVSDLENLGMPNNAISSLRVPRGYSVAIYENDFYRGQGRLLEADNRCLIGDPLSGQISSIVVEAPRVVSRTDAVASGSTSLSSNVGGGNAAVSVYTKCSYEGGRAGLAEGEYNAADLQKLGIKENTISSVKVNPGYQVELFFYDFQRGKSGYLRADDDCLINDGFDNEISSLKITKIAEDNRPLTPVASEQTSAATVYGQCDFLGGSVSLKPGRYPQEKLRELGIANDVIASLKVQEGHTVVLYDNGQLRGKGVAFTANDACLQDDGLMRRVSGMIIAPTRKKQPRAAAPQNSVAALSAGLECVGLYVNRNICEAARWNDIVQRCKLAQVPLMSDGYLEGHVKRGNCTERYWKDLQSRVRKPNLR